MINNVSVLHHHMFIIGIRIIHSHSDYACAHAKHFTFVCFHKSITFPNWAVCIELDMVGPHRGTSLGVWRMTLEIVRNCWAIAINVVCVTMWPDHSFIFPLLPTMVPLIFNCYCHLPAGVKFIIILQVMSHARLSCDPSFIFNQFNYDIKSSACI